MDACFVARNKTGRRSDTGTGIRIIKMTAQTDSCLIAVGSSRTRVLRRLHVMFAMAIDATRRPLYSRHKCHAVIGLEVAGTDLAMASGANAFRKRFPVCCFLSRDSSDRMCRVAISACSCRTFSATIPPVNTQRKVRKLITRVAGGALDRSDTWCVGQLIRSEPFMAAHTSQLVVGRCAKCPRLDEEGDHPPIFGH